MICIVCKINPVSIHAASTCSLECACKLNYDDYGAIRVRLANAIAASRMPCKRGKKSKA